MGTNPAERNTFDVRIGVAVLVLVLAPFFAVIQPAWPQSLPVLSGQSGLSHVVRPEVYESSTWLISGQAMYTDHHREDPRGETGHIGMSVMRGDVGGLDVSAFAVYAAVQSGTEGLRGLGASAKALFGKWPGPLRLGIWAAVLAPVGSREELVASGEWNYLGELLASYPFGAGELVVNFGLGKLDAYVRSKDGLRAETIATARFGYWKRVHPDVLLAAELVGSSVVRRRDEDLFFQAVAGWEVRQGILLRASAGLGLPDSAKANTNVRAVLGISYRVR